MLRGKTQTRFWQLCCGLQMLLGIVVISASAQLPYPELSIDSQARTLSVTYLATGASSTIVIEVSKESDGKSERVGRQELPAHRGQQITAIFPIPTLANCLYHAEVWDGQASVVEVKILYRSHDRSPGKARTVSSIVGAPLALLAGFLDRLASTVLAPADGTAVYRVNLARGGLVPQKLFALPDCTPSELRPAPDSASIAFSCLKALNKESTLWLFHVNGDAPSPVADGRSPVWDRDGKSLYFLQNRELKHLRISDNSLTSVTVDAPSPLLELLGVSRDGSGSLLASSRLGSNSYQIWSVDPRSGHCDALSYDVAYLWMPFLAPDGKAVLFTDYGGFSRKERIVLQQLDGRRRNVTDGNNNDRIPAWSADGQSVLFVSDRPDVDNAKGPRIWPLLRVAHRLKL